MFHLAVTRPRILPHPMTRPRISSFDLSRPRLLVPLVVTFITIVALLTWWFVNGRAHSLLPMGGPQTFNELPADADGASLGLPDAGSRARALGGRDFAGVARLAHDMRGVGTSYGFEGITDIGAALEEAAGRSDSAASTLWVGELCKYLDGVEVVPE